MFGGATCRRRVPVWLYIVKRRLSTCAFFEIKPNINANLSGSASRAGLARSDPKTSGAPTIARSKFVCRIIGERLLESSLFLLIFSGLVAFFANRFPYRYMDILGTIAPVASARRIQSSRFPLPDLVRRQGVFFKKSPKRNGKTPVNPLMRGAPKMGDRVRRNGAKTVENRMKS